MSNIEYSKETLSSRVMARATEKHDAQLVVCQYVEVWFSHLDEAGQIAQVNELFDILGIAPVKC